ncbi:MAG: DegT/DnrJ/EryC1/StrS family aminotransferase [Actinomycetota bacterium]
MSSRKKKFSEEVIPVNAPLLGERDLEYVAECVRSGWVSSAGRFIHEFEDRWAARCGRRFGVAVTNGTSALQLSVASLGLKADDEIIMPTFTIISCALAALYNGCTPMLVDSDPTTWCMDPDLIEEKITSRTSAIMPVHIYGHPVDMDPILALARERGLRVIEDAAEAHGAEYQSRLDKKGGAWRICGSFGDVSAFSFYANKPITTGEGGMLVTDDPDIADRARSLRNLGFDSTRRFSHEELGYNFRMTNMQAALGLAQVERFDEIVARKRSIGARYNELLGDIDALQLPPEQRWGKNVYWMYGIVVRDQAIPDAAEMSERLARKGVETRPFFIGMHEQPVLRARNLFKNEAYPVAERLARRGLYLPSGLALTDEQIQRVAEAVRASLSG